MPVPVGLIVGCCAVGLAVSTLMLILMLTIVRSRSVVLSVTMHLDNRFLCRIIEPLFKGVGRKLLAETGAVENCPGIVVDLGRPIYPAIIGVSKHKVYILRFQTGNEIVLAG